jgi:hypothetical protein
MTLWNGTLPPATTETVMVTGAPGTTVPESGCTVKAAGAWMEKAAGAPAAVRVNVPLQVTPGSWRRRAGRAESPAAGASTTVAGASLRVQGAGGGDEPGGDEESGGRATGYDEAGDDAGGAEPGTAADEVTAGAARPDGRPCSTPAGCGLATAAEPAGAAPGAAAADGTGPGRGLVTSRDLAAPVTIR